MQAFGVLKEAVQGFFADKGLRLAAALAYYTLFSLAPFLLIIIGVAGLVFGAHAVQTAVVAQAGSLIGPAAAEQIQTILTAAQERKTGIVATIVGVLTLVLGATGLVGQLKDALNTVWNVKAPKRGFFGLVRTRLLSLAMVVGVAFLLLVSLLVSAVLAALDAWSSGFLALPPVVLQVISFVVSVAVFTLLFAASFKFLPDARVQWRHVWIGAFITAVLFGIGKEVIGLYIGNSALASTFGAAASVVVILVWVYYAAAIFLFGAELTQAYARSKGVRIGKA
jgi:membrane protein